MKAQAIREPAHLSADLKELKLPSVVVHWERLAEEAQRKRQPHPEYLADLMHAEVNDRRERRIARQIRDACRAPRQDRATATRSVTSCVA